MPEYDTVTSILEADVYTPKSQETGVQTLPRERVERKAIFYPMIKRILDIILSCVALVVLSPLFLIVAIAIKLDSKGSVFYSHQRIGKNSTPFTMYKFRSMCVDADERLEDLQELNERDGPVFKIANDPRVTRVGMFIRKTCIDELPQLVNILKGDMSIVGPRPPLPNEVEQYTPYHLQRLSITPGLTCFWQVSDREMSFDDWVQSDIDYIQNMSPWTDLKILFLTLGVVFRQLGAK